MADDGPQELTNEPLLVFFDAPQIVGFAFLLAGTAIYNKILTVPNCYFDHHYWSDKEAADAAGTSPKVEMEAGDETRATHVINLGKPLLADGNGRSDQY